MDLIPSSSNLAAKPSRVAMMICFLPSVNSALISSSPSSIFKARMPALRGLENSAREVFLVVPFLVTINRYRSSLNSRTVMMALIVSSGERLIKEAIFFPLAIRLASGSS